MRILVTGGSGFIGSHLLKRLLQQPYREHNVLNIDCLTYAGYAKNHSHFDSYSSYAFKKIDIRDEVNLRDAIIDFNPEIVFHLAAESHVDNSITTPHNFIQTNIIGTFNLLRICHPLNNLAKFIYINTDEVYGSLDERSSKPFDEDSKFEPNSPYSASKASGGMLVRSWYSTYQFPAIITYCSNNYGSMQHPEKLIPKTILNVLDKKPIPVYGDGSNIRDWIHVDDHIDALITVMEDGEIGSDYNIGANCEITNLELVEKICDHINPSAKDLIRFVKDRPGHDYRYALDCDLIKTTLSWQPTHAFNLGLKDTIEWYERNRDWWSSNEN